MKELLQKWLKLEERVSLLEQKLEDERASREKLEDAILASINVIQTSEERIKELERKKHWFSK